MANDDRKTAEYLLENEYIISITGTTASGKSGVAVELAERLGGEIISLDSMQVYRGMDIGTAKITEEEMKGIPHHLLSIVPLTRKFSAGEFAELAREKISEIRSRGALPVVVGGTGLYLRALLKGLFPTPARSVTLRARLEKWEKKESLCGMHRYLRRVDPESAGMIDENDRQRIYRALEIFIVTGKTPRVLREKHGFDEDLIKAIKICLTREPREKLYEVINSRVEDMINEGLIDEVRALLKEYSPDLHPFKAIGYGEAVRHILEDIPLDETIEDIKRATRKYAKRQLTWFRKEENVRWFDAEEGKELVCRNILKYIESHYYMNEEK